MKKAKRNLLIISGITALIIVLLLGGLFFVIQPAGLLDFNKPIDIEATRENTTITLRINPDDTIVACTEGLCKTMSITSTSIEENTADIGKANICVEGEGVTQPDNCEDLTFYPNGTVIFELTGDKATWSQ